MTNHTHQSKRGFTLIELMVAVSIFIIVMAVSTGSLLTIFSANRQTRSIKSVMNNLNLAVESMSKEMRYGTSYHCGSTGNQASPQDCASGGTYLSFVTSDAVQTTYRLSGSTLEKQSANGSFISVTSPDVLVDKLAFYVLGAAASDGLQPRIVIVLKGHVGTGSNRSDFDLQTEVSQRKRDS